MKILPKTEFGNPILRIKTKPVKIRDLQTGKFKSLFKDMIYTMRRSRGVGLAANQVNVPFRIAVLEIRPTKFRPDVSRKGPIVIINPKITKFYSKSEIGWEGCLSLKGVRGQVKRASKIEVEYLNPKGETVRETATGLWARIFQHEIDHLNGIGCMDRMNTKTIMTVKEFKKRILKQS